VQPGKPEFSDGNGVNVSPVLVPDDGGGLGSLSRASGSRPSWASTPDIRRRMQGQRTRDTKPEMVIRRMVHRAGLRYRVDRAPVVGVRRRADLVFAGPRLAVFVDGCFWHGCPQHCRLPARNYEFWQAKIERNFARDLDTTRRLEDAGWRVLRIWEHEPPEQGAQRLIATVRGAVDLA
jgi:DNA mismatch endonuclease, patch repair protein